MSFFLVVALFAVAVALVFALTLDRRTRLPNDYLARKPLSEPEQTLYWRLKEAVPECVVLAQVSFARFLEAKAPTPQARRSMFNRISQKTADYLICLPDFTVVAIVELDDGSHRSGPDAIRDAIVHSGGIPVVRVNVNNLPSVADLRAMFTR